jgi:hypothetical protein
MEADGGHGIGPSKEVGAGFTLSAEVKVLLLNRYQGTIWTCRLMADTVWTCRLNADTVWTCRLTSIRWQVQVLI